MLPQKILLLLSGVSLAVCVPVSSTNHVAARAPLSPESLHLDPVRRATEGMDADEASGNYQGRRSTDADESSGNYQGKRSDVTVEVRDDADEASGNYQGRRSTDADESSGNYQGKRSDDTIEVRDDADEASGNYQG